MHNREIYRWYLLRTAFRKEKKVKDLLDIAGIENYIPFETIGRTWGGIEKEVEVPVFPNCAFVYVSAFDLETLKFLEEVSFLTNKDGSLFFLTDEQMNNIKKDPSDFLNELSKQTNS